jgi:murein L,D-transpeptidase YafK
MKRRRIPLLALFATLSSLVHAEARADRILIEKSAHQMTLFRAGIALHTYKVSLGTVAIGAKTQQGDHRTPEGNYVIDGRVDHSRFYKALHVSYPNAADRARAAKLHVNPGGDIMIHGLPNGTGFVGKAHLLRDWTNGCVAVTNNEMDEIWSLVSKGTKVEIRP